MRYESKRDPERVRSLRLISSAFLLAGLMAAVGVMWMEALFLLSLMCLGLGLAVEWMVRSTGYEIGDGVLRIRSGAARTTIPLADIVRIQPSNERWNAPALSFERLRVEYRRGRKQGSVLISPADRHAFLDEINGLLRTRSTQQ